MKERGLNFGMEEQMKSSENNLLKNEPQLSEKAVYGFPFYPRWLSELKIMKCMPFLPNYD